MADYINTTWARKRMESNSKKITELQKKLATLTRQHKDTAATQQKIDDLIAENNTLQGQIDALGISSKDVGGTTGNYATVPTTNSFAATDGQSAGQTGSGGGASADALPKPGISQPVLALVVLVILGAVFTAWRIIKRKKRHG